MRIRTAVQFCLGIEGLFGLALRQIEPLAAIAPGPTAGRDDGAAIIPIRKNGPPWKEEGLAARAGNGDPARFRTPWTSPRGSN